MMPPIFTRREWDGTMRELGDAWRLQKNGQVARAVIVTPPLGLEPRLLLGDDLRQSQVHRDGEALLDQAETWKRVMTTKGWS